MPEELTFTDQNFKEEIKEGVTLVDFWAPWCAPCQMQGPIIEEIAKETENIKVGKLNVDENQLIAQEYGVMSIPTLIIFKNGQPFETMIGVRQKEELKSKLDEALK